MIKKVTSILLFAGFAGGAYAQQQKNFVFAGIGYNRVVEYSDPVNLWPVINCGYERLLPIKAGPGTFGVGLTASYRNVKEPMPFWEDGMLDYIYIRHNYTVAAFRVTYHLNEKLIKSDKIDLYWGLQSGVRFYSRTYDRFNIYEDLGYNFSERKLHVAFLAGMRYFFLKHFGAYTEVGYDVSIFKLGVAMWL